MSPNAAFPKIFLLILIAAAVAIALRSLFFRRRIILTEPSCGKCGYCVRGIPGLTCPECGSDLREVGILTANAPVHSSTALKSALWTLALPLAALLISWILLITVLPFSLKQKGNRVVFCQAPYLNVILQVQWQRQLAQAAFLFDGNTTPDEITVFDPTWRSLDVNLKTGAFSYRRADGSLVQQPSGFGGLVLANWLAGPGIDPKDSRVLDLADAACAAINEIPRVINTSTFTPLRDRAFLQVGMAHPANSWVVHDEPSPWVVCGLAGFWILVWLYGLRRIHRTSTAASAPRSP
jgi:hypothetical protein